MGYCKTIFDCFDNICCNIFLFYSLHESLSWNRFVNLIPMIKYNTIQKIINTLYSISIIIYILFVVLILAPAMLFTKISKEFATQTVMVTREDTTQLTKYKKAKDFYSKGDWTNEPHPINKRLIQVVQGLEFIYGDCIIISSTYRTPEQNKACGGVKNSNHLKGNAIDIVMPQRELQHFFKNHKWVKKYITEFGYYNDFVHLAVDNKKYREFKNKKHD